MKFTFTYTQEQLERACNEVKEIRPVTRWIVADDEVDKGWDAKLYMAKIYITKHDDIYRVANIYSGKIARYFKCRFDGDEITIIEAMENGRTLKADRYLKTYAQCAMRIFAIVKCGKID